jgi:hypothetical protein
MIGIVDKFGGFFGKAWNSYMSNFRCGRGSLKDDGAGTQDFRKWSL